ncbi:MAG: hypothetical protein AAGA74_04780 [Pseudomonadota bacterium]
MKTLDLFDGSNGFQIVDSDDGLVGGTTFPPLRRLHTVQLVTSTETASTISA